MASDEGILERLQTALADRYQIEREIGSGGMATVYLAEDLRHHRKVAVKVLDPGLAETLGAERFLREIETAANLTHPHILPLHDSGEADGLLFYVMPFVKGESLRARLTREKQLPIEDAVHITREIADALAYAHEQGVVHRDVKPANIMFEAGHAVLADFGVAHAVAEAKDERITRTGTSLGTPAYMSPEQASGEGDLDGRSDQYALGCVLYEMLAGHPPFAGAQVEAVVRQHLASEPPSVSLARPSVPCEVERVIIRALAKSPADRFRTTGEMAAALALSTAPEGPDRKNNTNALRIALGVAAIAVIALVGTLVLRPGWGPSPGSPDLEQAQRPSIAVLPFQNRSGVEEDAYFTDGIHDEMLTQLSKIGALSVRGRTSVMEYRDSPKNLREIGEELNARYLVEGGVQRAGDEVRITVQLIDARADEHLWAETYDRKLTTENIFTIQSDVATRIASALKANLTADEQRMLDAHPTKNLEAYDSYLTGLDLFRRRIGDSWAVAQERLERAVELDPDFALAYAWLSRVHMNLYYFGDGTAERLTSAKAAADRAIALNPDLPEAHLALGLYYYWGFLDYARALEHYNRARELNPNDGTVYHLLAVVYRRMGEWDQAVTSHERAAELSPRMPGIIGETATSFWFLRDYERAVAQYDRAIDLDPIVNFFYQWKVLACLDRGDVEEAWRTMEEMRENTNLRFPGITHVLARIIMRVFHQRFWGDLHDPSFQGPFLWKAQSYQLAGDAEASRAYYDSARVATETGIRENPEWNRDYSIHSDLGVAYAGLGRRADAIREAERALELHPMTEDALIGTYPILGLAEVKVMIGDYSGAMDQIEYLLSIPSPVSMALLEIDPIWEPLRDAPRFQALLKKYKDDVEH